MESGQGSPILTSDTLGVPPFGWIDDETFLVSPRRSVQGDRTGLYEASLGGELKALTVEPGIWPEAHPDGNQIVFTTFLERSIQVIHRDGTPGFDLEVRGHQKDLSPDGDWLAFRNNDGIFIAPYPSGGSPRLVVEAPAEMPRWSANGDALFFRDAGEFWKVPVQVSERGIETGPAVLFASGPFVRVVAWAYAVTPEDHLLAVMGPPERSTDHLEVITNFTSVLEERAPRKR
jgi:hypothetical protein